MYELTCPYCRHVASSSFVRKGAMARCAQCGRDYLIKAETYRRTAAEVPESLEALSATAATAPPAQAAAPPPAAPARPAPATPTVRATPLPPAASNPGSTPPPTQAGGTPARPAPARPPAGDSPRPAPAPVLDPGAPNPNAPPPDPDVVRVLARRARKRQINPAARWLILFLLLSVFVVVVLVKYHEAQKRSQEGLNPLVGAETRPAIPASQPAHNNLPPVDQRVAILNAEALPLAGKWFSADEPAKFNTPDPMIVLRKENVARLPDAGSYYEAEVVAQTFEFIETATVHLALVDANDHVFARTRLTLVLLNSQRSVPLRVDIPTELVNRTSRVDARIEAGPRLPGGVLFDDTLVEPVSAKKGFAVKITAYNPLTQPLKRALFLLTARDDKGRAVGQWQATWTQPIGSRQRVEFQSFIGAENAADWHWEVAAAGTTEPAPDAAPASAP